MAQTIHRVREVDNQKDQKILDHIERGIELIRGVMLKPDEIEVLEAISRWHLLTEDLVTEMEKAEATNGG
jgi:hypothetical protein